jgi:nicotinamidase-related amidase
MKKISKYQFIEKSSKVLSKIVDSLEELPILKLEALVGKAALIVIDMNNGFAKGGALYSPRIEGLIPEISRLAHAFGENKNIPVIFVNEDHPEDAKEFASYPPHCVRGTEEIDIIKELQDIDNKILIGKNCTNAFAVDEFKDIIMKLTVQGIKDFIIIGDCTDICIYQAAVSAKTYFNHNNIDAEVIVPISAVDTYDLEVANHEGDLMNVIFLYSMLGNGVKVIKGIH